MNLAFSHFIVDSLHLLVELFNVGIHRILEVKQSFNHFYQISLLGALETINTFTKLELIPTDGFLDEILPVAMINLLDIELPFDFTAAVLNILFVGEDLSHDKVEITFGDFF